MTATSDDQYWLDIAEAISKKSKCCRRQVGAIIVNNNRIVQGGYNGAPKGFPDTGHTSCKTFCPAAMDGIRASTDGYDKCVAVHAEINALLLADRAYLEGATIYVPHSVCMNCAKAIANSGIFRVVVTPSPRKVDEDKAVRKFLHMCGLIVKEL